jgi:hypothetical protein
MLDFEPKIIPWHTRAIGIFILHALLVNPAMRLSLILAAIVSGYLLFVLTTKRMD